LYYDALKDANRARPVPHGGANVRASILFARGLRGLNGFYSTFYGGFRVVRAICVLKLLCVKLFWQNHNRFPYST